MNIVNNGQELFVEISSLIEQTRQAVYANANKATVLLFWNIGRRISSDVLYNKRAGYGKQIVSALPTQLSWWHFVEVLPLKTMDAKLYYLNEAAATMIGAKAMRKLISR